jgi:PKD repeat protein
MKRIVFSLVTVVMVVMMMLPATSPPPVAAQSFAWPTAWEELDTDDNENCDTHRNVLALYYDVDSDYIYLRMETATAPGWPSTKPAGDARYKFWFDTGGTASYVSGTSVYNAEFLLILEDLTDNSNDPDTTRDLLGELTFMDDLNNDGFRARWDSSNPPNYTINNAQTTPTGNSSWWRRQLASVSDTPGVGGPQEVLGADIGYRIDNGTTGGNFVDVYVSRAVLGDPTSLCIIWATDNQNSNLDQAPNCDRPEQPNCIMLGKDFGDAPAPYPTKLDDGACHAVGNISLGTIIDAELDGIPSPDATGDDNDNLDDEDGVDFTTALIKGQSTDITVTVSGGAGYLDAWVDFDVDGDWGDADEQIFTNQSLSAGTHNLNFTVPFSAQAGDTFARFRFSSAGGLSYDGPADDGEVEDYQVAIEGCTITVDLTGNTSFCEGSSTTITANVTDGAPPYTYDWLSDSTAQGTPNNGSFTATGSGIVAVTVTDDNDCTGSANLTVTALQGPTAAFSANATSCCDPLAVQFTDLSAAGDNDIIYWEWDFGDGTNSTSQHPIHIYTTGTYNVTLTVTDSFGCSDTKTEENYITANQGPTAAFSANVTECCAPLAVNFTDESTKGSNNITEWYWEFGDGGTSNLTNPSHTYAAGTYNVTLTVTDKHGCSGTKTEENYITANQGPTADFSANATSCCDPLAVQFTDESTKGSNNITDWFWDFGDGTNSTDQHPIHIYTTGTYNVTLTVTDKHGCSGTKTEENYITANEGPTAAFSANVTECCAPLAVNFTDESTKGSNNITEWYWEFGDGGTSNLTNPSHTYAAGTYNVTLTVTDKHGCSDNETKAVTIYGKPTATASSNSPVIQGATIELYGGPDCMVSYNWTGPGGWTSDVRNPTRPTATTGMAGTYTLIVTDSNGCTDDATTNVVVIVPERPRGGGGGCPEIKYLTVDWDGHNTTERLLENDTLAVDLLGPNPDTIHSLLLEKGTHAPVVGGRTYYLIVIRELEEVPPLPENTTAIVAFNVTPEGAVFDRDIFLTLGFDELPENALNATMAYYDDVNGTWMELEYEAGGPPNTVAELSLSAPLNHFTIYAVLVEVTPVTPPQPANFVGSGLNIEPSVEKTTFVTKTGESVSITANVANDGGQEGTYTVELKLDGQTVDTEVVILGIGQSQQVSFALSEMDYGQHEVEVAGLNGEFTTSRTITWWLIIVIIVAIGLIIWGVVWGRRRRRRAAQEG